MTSPGIGEEPAVRSVVRLVREAQNNEATAGCTPVGTLADGKVVRSPSGEAAVHTLRPCPRDTNHDFPQPRRKQCCGRCWSGRNSERRACDRSAAPSHLYARTRNIPQSVDIQAIPVNGDQAPSAQCAHGRPGPRIVNAGLPEPLLDAGEADKVRWRTERQGQPTPHCSGPLGLPCIAILALFLFCFLVLMEDARQVAALSLVELAPGCQCRLGPAPRSTGRKRGGNVVRTGAAPGVNDHAVGNSVDLGQHSCHPALGFRGQPIPPAHRAATLKVTYLLGADVQTLRGSLASKQRSDLGGAHTRPATQILQRLGTPFACCQVLRITVQHLQQAPEGSVAYCLRSCLPAAYRPRRDTSGFGQLLHAHTSEPTLLFQSTGSEGLRHAPSKTQSTGRSNYSPPECETKRRADRPLTRRSHRARPVRDGDGAFVAGVPIPTCEVGLMCELRACAARAPGPGACRSPSRWMRQTSTSDADLASSKGRRCAAYWRTVAGLWPAASAAAKVALRAGQPSSVRICSTRRGRTSCRSYGRTSCRRCHRTGIPYRPGVRARSSTRLATGPQITRDPQVAHRLLQ
ncbi:hypothetical protein YWIDRAFT_07107 [Streptomyces sp. SceaMP-e96]|nr:hypothetical protein YWIDRAFT_07107 [Streptomyces sp. SceaMP-e96]